MNPLEQQLKRLPVVDSRWVQPNPYIPQVCLANRYECHLGVWGEQLQGGEALWFMLSELQERWMVLCKKDLFEGLSETESKEKDILEREIDWVDLSAGILLDTYIQWKEAVK